MCSYKIENKIFEKYISALELKKAVGDIAKRINEDYKGKEILFIVVLNGAFMFASDLFKQTKVSCKISFVKVSSYNNENSTGKFKQLIGLNENIKDKNVIIVEDIVDSGFTMLNIREQLLMQEPNNLEIATLLLKPLKFQQKYPIKYIGMNIENPFIVGYGLDFNGYGRNLPDIYQIKG